MGLDTFFSKFRCLVKGEIYKIHMLFILTVFTDNFFFAFRCKIMLILKLIFTTEKGVKDLFVSKRKCEMLVYNST